MDQKIVVPVLGESITEATVAKWLKNKGESVTADEPLVELETDKVNLEVPSPINGILKEVNSKDGDIVEVGSILGMISENEIEKNNKTNEIKKIQPTITSPETESNKELEQHSDNLDINKLESDEKEESDQDKNFFSAKDKITQSKQEDEPLLLSDEIQENKIEKSSDLSPAVRKIVEERKIDIQNVKGTGKDGRILKSDLINLMGSIPQPNERKKKYGPEERIKMTRLRQTIAKRLKEAQENAAMLTTFNEVDMTNIISMRKDNQLDFQKRYGTKLGFMSFFVKSCILGLKLFPAINAEIDSEEIVYKNYYNISFAVGTDRGLVVPVIENADELSFADIEKEIIRLSDLAKNGKLSIENLQGGTFTISNGGVYGSMLSTPILNPPQSGVLGMHNIVERPIVVEGEIKIRPVMYLALSYDHRIIDGKDSVSFLKVVKENLEDPRRLFLNI